LNKVSIDYQTGTDECSLVGTKQQILEFVASIQNALNDTQERELYGIKINSVDLAGSVDIHSSQGIGISEIIVCDTDDNKALLVKNMANE